MEKIVFLAKGNCTLGRTTTDQNGNMLSQTPARFEFSSNGSCVAVGEMDAETMEVIGSPSLYGDWQASDYLREALIRLAPVRVINIPNIKQILIAAKADGQDILSDFCSYCDSLRCGECVVRDLKEDLQ